MKKIVKHIFNIIYERFFLYVCKSLSPSLILLISSKKELSFLYDELLFSIEKKFEGAGTLLTFFIVP